MLVKEDETMAAGQPSQQLNPGQPPAPEGNLQGKPLHSIWDEVKEACLNPAHPRYAEVGAAGVTFVPEWRAYPGFQAWALAHGYRNGLFLLRRDPAGPFSPENCAWVASPLAGIGGPKRHWLTAFGETKTLTAWARDARCMVCARQLLKRLQKGMSHEQAMTTPAVHMLTAWGESKSLQDWARDSRCVVNATSVAIRLKKGWSPEEALTHAAVVHDRMITAFGESKSVRAWTRDPRFSISTTRLRDRLDKGWSPEEALSLPAWADIPDLTAFGETKRLHAWANDPRCLVTYTTLRSRLRKGWTPEEALTRTAYPNFSFLTAFGETKSLRAWERDACCRVRRIALAERLAAGWDAERALTTPAACAKPNAVRLTAFGESKALTAWARDARCGVSLDCLRGRVSHGWSPEDALTRLVTETPTATRLLTVFDEVKHLSAWARDPRCVVSYDALYERLARGMSPEDALTRPKGYTPSNVRVYAAFDEEKSLSAWRRDPRACVGVTILARRLTDGWDLERALTTPPSKTRANTRLLMAFGERKSVTAWARDPRCHVSKSALKYRLNKGMSLEEALTRPSGEANAERPMLTAFGELKRLADWLCDPRCVVSSGGLHGRLEKGMSFEDALTRPVADIPTATRYIRAFGEVKYLSAWARDARCVVSLHTLDARLARGMSPEDALTRSVSETQSNAHFLIAFGETKSLTAWARDPRCCVGRAALAARLAAGWDTARALTTSAYTEPRRRKHD
jgi:hypothetical protein